MWQDPYSSWFWSLGFPSSTAHHGYTVTVASTIAACGPSPDVFCSFPHCQHFREGCFSLFIAFHLSRHKRQLHCSWRNFHMCSTKRGQRRRELVSTEHLSHARPKIHTWQTSLFIFIDPPLGTYCPHSIDEEARAELTSGTKDRSDAKALATMLNC